MDVRALRDAAAGWPLIVLEEVTSTNDEARRRGHAGEPAAAVFAEVQSAGRGRRGARWSSPPRRNLLFSLLLRPPAPPADWPRLTHGAALAVAEALDPFLESEPLIKWPNDVFVGEKKIAGILLESVLGADEQAFAIIGIGLNVNTAAEDFPPELRPVATSLRIESGRHQSREPVAARLLQRLHQRLDQCWSDFPHILSEVARRSLLLGREVIAQTPQGLRRGLATGLSPQGGLLLQPDAQPPIELTSVDFIRPVEAMASGSRSVEFR